MKGQGGRWQLLRLDDPLGHLVPPGQLIPSDITAAIRKCIDAHRYGTGLGVPSIPSRFVVRMHPADRAFLPPGFQREAAATATSHADSLGLLMLDGIRVSFQTDLECEMGTLAVSAGYSEQDLVVLRDPSAAATTFKANA